MDVFTREKGLRSFIVSGVRSSKTKNKASLYQHLNILDLVAYDKDDKLARIKECRIEYHYKKLAYDVVRSSIGLFILEVCKNAIREREENIPLFDFIYSRLTLLDSEEPINLSLFSIKFMLELSEHIGFMPTNNFHSDTPYFDLYNGKYLDHNAEKYVATKEVSAAIGMIDHMAMDGLIALSYPKELRNQVIDDMVIYYRLHIEQFRELKTLDVLRTIF
ncbi:MAG: DNA repair protein RecO (recombination protein O) [Halioglobus sp.]